MSSSRYKKSELDDAASDERLARRIDALLADASETGEKVLFYANETNGIQALPLLLARGIVARFCNIRSTHFENKSVSAAICDLPQEMLLSLAKGEQVAVLDYGARKDVSRAIYQGIPFIKYALDRAWSGYDAPSVPIRPRSNTRAVEHDAREVFGRWYALIGRRGMRHVMPYADIARESLIRPGAGDISYTGCGEMPRAGVRIAGLSEATSHDNDKLYYANVKKEYLDALAERLGSDGDC